MDQPIEKNEVIYPGSNRIGKFNLQHELLRDGAERPMLQALFGLCVVLGTEAHESGRGLTYIAASDLFQPLAEGEEIPEYRKAFRRTGSGAGRKAGCGAGRRQEGQEGREGGVTGWTGAISRAGSRTRPSWRTAATNPR